MKVVICGAGIAGLALAHRLDALGWEVVVLERAPGPRPQGYMIDFFGDGYDAAEAAGVLPRIRELGYRIEELHYVDGAGRSRAVLPIDRLTSALGGRLVSIMRPDLERALREQLSGEVDMRFATRPARIDEDADGVRVVLEDGSALEADLLVGADGIHSAVRRMVFGPERDYLRSLGFHTGAFTFEAPELHAALRSRVHLTDTIDRQMGFYALRDGRIATFAVHRETGPLPADPRAALRERYSSVGWVVPQVLAQCPPGSEVYYDDVAQVEVPRWSRGRVVLLGDSCQAVSLLAGQGASLAVAGAHVLAEQLAAAGTAEEGLERYERLWRPVVEEKQQLARKGVRWFLPHSRSQQRARRLALVLARLPLLDRLLAAGLVGKSAGIVGEARVSGRAPEGV